MFLVVGGMAIGISTIVSRQSALAEARSDTLEAFYAAEAGRELAMRELVLGVDEDGDGGVGSISDDGDDSTDPVVGTARVVVTRESTGAIEVLRSTGVASTARRSIEATVVPGDGLGGYIHAETWWNLSGSGVSITRLTADPAYPDQPDEVSILTSFATTPNVADGYGIRVIGCLVPPTTGSYTFWIASDDHGELWLSTDEGESNTTRIAHVPGDTSPQEWDKYTQQESIPIALVADRRYFIYAIAVDATGDDHLSVAWEGPGITREVISGAHLSPP